MKSSQLNQNNQIFTTDHELNQSTMKSSQKQENREIFTPKSFLAPNSERRTEYLGPMRTMSVAEAERLMAVPGIFANADNNPDKGNHR